MKVLKCLVVSVMVLFLVSCEAERRAKPETTPKQATKKSDKRDMKIDENVLFEDTMTANWQENWFLDGKKATVEHREGGLYVSGGTITKKQDREKYHAHHAVLWTKQVFNDDLFISFDMKRVDTSNYGNTLLYIQAQGVGTPPYANDITEWNKLREVPAMSTYFTYMSLISLSFRENIRCKRYPLRDVNGEPMDGAVFKPYGEYGGVKPGTFYSVEVEKKNPMITIRLYETKTRTLVKEFSWDVSKNPKEQMPRLIEKGRIGLRHMSTKQFIYKNFKVRQL